MSAGRESPSGEESAARSEGPETGARGEGTRGSKVEASCVSVTPEGVARNREVGECGWVGREGREDP